MGTLQTQGHHAFRCGPDDRKLPMNIALSTKLHTCLEDEVKRTSSPSIQYLVPIYVLPQ